MPIAAQLQPSPRGNNEFISLFMTLSNRIAELGRERGIRIVPFRDPALPFFSQKRLEDQRKILGDLSNYLGICEAAVQEGGQLHDPVAISWAAIKELGFRPPSDLFTYVRKDSVIEIHDPVGIQIFRNFRFYSYCSYSLEELHCFPWNHLYSRNDKVLHDLLGWVGKVYSGEIRGTTKTDLPPHVIEENYSPFNYKIQAEVAYIAPLYDETRRPVATVVIEKGSLVGKPLSPDEEEELLKKFFNSPALNPYDMY